MTRILGLVLICCGLGGCTVFQPVADIGDKFPGESRVTQSDVAQIPLGSQVEIFCKRGDASETYVGTVIHASNEGAVLANCVQTGRVEQRPPQWLRFRFANRLFKNSGVGAHRIPVQWVSQRNMTTLNVIAPPPADYVAPQLQIDTNDESFYERIGIDFEFSERENRVILRDSEPVRTPLPRSSGA